MPIWRQKFEKNEAGKYKGIPFRKSDPLLTLYQRLSNLSNSLDRAGTLFFSNCYKRNLKLDLLLEYHDSPAYLALYKAPVLLIRPN